MYASEELGQLKLSFLSMWLQHQCAPPLSNAFLPSYSGEEHRPHDFLQKHIKELKKS